MLYTYNVINCKARFACCVLLVCVNQNCVFLLQDNLIVLNFGIGSASWWMTYGYGCHPVTYSHVTPVVHTYSTAAQSPANLTLSTQTNVLSATVLLPATTSSVDASDVVIGCLVEYHFIEVLHAAVECLLTASGLDNHLFSKFHLNFLQLRSPQKGKFSKSVLLAREHCL